KMCAEAAVCFALGLPHGDEPPCVGRAVRAFKIRLNDCAWSSNQARAKGLRRIAIAQLGSNEIDQDVFRKELARLTIKTIVPIALRAAAKLQKEQTRKNALEDAAVSCEKDPSIEKVKAAKKIAADAADAAYAAADAADAAAAAAYATRDEILSIAAELGVQALIFAKSPGCQ